MSVDLKEVKNVMELGAAGVSILISLSATIYKFLQDKAGLTAEEIHRRVGLELDATAKALADAEQREKDLYDATHPKP